MKRRYVTTVLALVLFAPLLIGQAQSSQASQSGSHSTPTGTQAAHAPKPNCTDNGRYVNSKGETVKRPENCSAAPQGATAQCRDGTYSFSRSRRGTCSHHGGVAKWL